MSLFKYFAPPEWDDDVPEMTQGQNLTKKNKLRRKAKNTDEEKIENTTDSLSSVPVKRRSDSNNTLVPKKKSKQFESESYIKFDSSIINNTLTDVFQVEANEINHTTPKKKNKKKKNKAKVPNNVDVNVVTTNNIIKKIKSKKDKVIQNTHNNVNVETTENIKKKTKSIKEKVIEHVPDNIDTNVETTDNVLKKIKSKKNKSVDKDNNPSIVDTETGENKFKKNKSVDTVPRVISNNKSDKKSKKQVVSSESVSTNSNDASQSLDKKTMKKSKNQIKKEKKKKLTNLPQNGIPAKEPVFSKKHDVKPVVTSKKSQSHVNKIKALLENMKQLEDSPETETKEVYTDNVAILSSINDKQESVKTTGYERKSLRERMMERLKGARFRYINEQLYVKRSSEAFQVFKEDPDAFKAYHNGYRQQISKWPINPLDIIIKDISKLPKDQVIADLGCGDARLAKSVPHKVYSFDLVALDPTINACDMSHTPLLTGQVNVIVFCLSLMSTNLKDYLIEANRILKIGGIMKIAEVESRFSDVDQFVNDVKKYGFSVIKKDLDHNLFYFMDFKKEKDVKKRNKVPDITLNPCLYKKR